MDSISDLLEQARGHEQRIAELSKELESASGGLNSALHDMHLRLSRNETTKNRHLDMVIYSHRSLSKELEAAYRALDESLLDRRDQLVTLLYPIKTLKGGWRTDRPREYEDVEFFRMGVLDSTLLVAEPIEFDSAFQWTFPVSRFIIGESRQMSTRYGSVSTRLQWANILERRNLETDSPGLNIPALRNMIERPDCMKLLLGDIAVREWLASHGAERFFDTATKILKRPKR